MGMKFQKHGDVFVLIYVYLCSGMCEKGGRRLKRYGIVSRILSGWMENRLKNICHKDSAIRRFFC